MAGYCTRGQYFHSPSARKKTSAHSYYILPYSTFTGAIILIYNYHCVDILFSLSVIVVHTYVPVHVWLSA